MNYRTAYRNENTKWEWFEISLHNDLVSAKRHIDAIAPDMERSELAIFSMPDGASYWKNRNPRYIYNRQPNNNPIPSSIGGIISSMYTPGKNPR